MGQKLYLDCNDDLAFSQGTENSYDIISLSHFGETTKIKHKSKRELISLAYQILLEFEVLPMWVLKSIETWF